MPRRSRAREVALQMLHEMEFNPGPDATDRARFLKGRLHSGPLVAFAASLIDGVHRDRDALDARLDAQSAHWRVSRMAATDRTVLRIALHELLHTDTPGPVVVDEAIELARRYGSEASPRFVAGILGGLLAERQAATDG
jgi:N utilization substance protein B